jgi:hypothetical protein
MIRDRETRILDWSYIVCRYETFKEVPFFILSGPKATDSEEDFREEDITTVE